MHGISQDGLYFGLAVRRERFMPGTKIKDFAVTSFPAAAGPEDFTSLEPGNEDRFVGSWNSERFAIHLFVGDLEVGLDSLSDGMSGLADPNPFLFSGFAPDQGAGCAHQTFKDF